ncbi:helix-turn-helix transcriptional regulator [Acidihalobacter aeolianus]|uniref:helix-turn-helix transcriptional regulator n=1 Tax=Acidihalobacter aeolianus TaxID=2792603 RepID=UPI0009F630F7|nr:helix-turn-helix domain-containing protein [Acidihalobacter aeolianus]
MGNPEEKVYSVSEFCALSRISKPTIYRLWQEGRGPESVRVGRKRLITESPLEYVRRIGVAGGAE